jgi:hypothetical protein
VEVDVRRKSVITGIPFLLGALHQPTRDWLLSVIGSADSVVEDGRVSQAKLRQIRRMVNMFAEADAKQGGGHGRQALAEYLRTTVLPLLRSETDEATRRELFDLAGEQSQLLGWMALDTGEYGLSERYLIQALRFSEESQNQVLGAHTLATMSHLATTLGHSDEGVQLARAGQGALRGGSQAMLADLAVLEARSHAIGGDARAAASSVHRAEQALRNVITENEPPEMRFIDQAYIAGEIANNLVLLGDAPRAIDFAEQSIDSSLAQGRSRRAALSNVALAKAHLIRRDVDGACVATANAIVLSRDVDSVRTTKALLELRELFASHRSNRVVLDLLVELEAAV